MIPYKKLTTTLTLAALIVFVAPQVDARQDNGSTTSRSGNSSSESSSHEAETEAHSSEVEAKHTNDQLEQTTKKQSESIRQNAKKEIESKRTTAGVSPEDKKKHVEKCEARKSGLVQKIANINTNAQNHLNRFNGKYDKAVQYQKDNGLNPAGFGDLIAAADAAKAKAQASVGALASLKPTVNCSSETVASDVAAYRTATSQARADLLSYRQSIKAIYGSIISSQQATTKESAGQ